MRRIIKASDDSFAGLEVTEESIRLSGSRDSLIYSDSNGISFVGNLSILTEPQNIRIATTFRLQTAYKLQLPSTTMNPTPVLVASSPISGFSSIAEEAARLYGELA